MAHEYGIVFSGGGALGAWEAGCYETILSRHNALGPRIVTGASAGAINAVGICAGMPPQQLKDTWSALSNDSVYRSRLSSRKVAAFLWSSICKGSIFEAFNKTFNNVSSILSTDPLIVTLTGILQGYFQNFLQSAVSCVISLTNLERGIGELYYKLPPGQLLPHDLGNDWNKIRSLDILVQVLVGSTAIPILFPPYRSYFDGGVLLNQPISPAWALICPEDSTPATLDLDNFTLYVIIPSSETLGATGNLLEIGSTVISTWLSLSLIDQIKNIRLRNYIRELRVDKKLRLCVIRPSQDLTNRFGVSLLDFGKNVPALIQNGAESASYRIDRFDQINENTWY
jgi:predicted acylesterase/phospholipase RssA